MKSTVVLTFLTVFALPSLAATNCEYEPRVALANLDYRPDSVTGLLENSGLGHSRLNNRVMWGENDAHYSDRDDWAYAFNTDGETLARYRIRTLAYDPEDLAMGPGPQPGVSYVYWGEVGGNTRIGNGGIINVWRFEEPAVDPDAGWVGDFDFTAQATQIPLLFPSELDSQNTDVETLMVDPDANIYVVTKRTNLNDRGSRLYIAPYPQSTGTYSYNQLQFVAEFPWTPLSSGTAVGGDISPDGSRMIMLNRGESSVYIYEKLPGEGWADAINAGRYCKFVIGFGPLLEAVAWDAENGRDFYTLSEGGAQPLYFYEHTACASSGGDADGDGVCDDFDICEGDDATGDWNGDGICNDLDPPPDVCNLDWNCDGVVDYDDVYGVHSQGFYSGFYGDVNLYLRYHDTHPAYVTGGYFHKLYCGEMANLDWNGNGVIEKHDVYEGSPALSNLDTFYTEWYVYTVYPSSYSYYYPDSPCDPLSE